MRVTAGATPDSRKTVVLPRTERRAALLPRGPSRGQDRPSVRAASPHLAVDIAARSIEPAPGSPCRRPRVNPGRTRRLA